MSKFCPGDRVQNVGEGCRCRGMKGVFVAYWADRRDGHLLTLRNACDVFYEGIMGPNGYLYTAQSADDLRLVEDSNSN